jgi:hypothetical protein
MNEVVLSNFDDGGIERSISAMTTEELREELARGLRLTADSLLRLAIIVKTLEERGEDLSGLRIGLLHHLRRIACGQVLPEIVVRYAGMPSLISVIGSLPLPDQRKLADGGSVELAVYAADGSITYRMADPLTMTRQQASQVFARDHIRSQAEQVLILEQQRSRAKGKTPQKIGDLRIDKELGGVFVGRKFIPLADLAAAVNALRK